MRCVSTVCALVAALTAVTIVTLGAQQQTPPPPPTTQQQPPAVFRTGTRTVPIYATVKDPDGGFATDLLMDDFEVKDNGKVQKITQFSTSMQPLSAILLLDGSGSMLPVFDAVLEAANSFIIRMQQNDQVRIASFADITRFAPAFTSDRDQLLEFLKNEFNIRMANETKLWDAVHQAIVFLNPLIGRKVIFLFTDGYDTVSTATMDGIISEAGKRNVSVYAVAMWTGRGLNMVRPNAELQRLTTDTGGGFYELKETDEMNSTFTRIATELHLQYVIGFTPQKLDGKLHDLEVKVKKKNFRVQARKNYLATPDDLEGGRH